MMKEGRISINSLRPQSRSRPILSTWREKKERIQSTRERGEEMAVSSSRNLTVEERLKQLDEMLEKLKQMLQFQLDFLENLDTEAGRRLEQLEQDISTVKIGFTEELDKLHQELKSPKDEFEDKDRQLEGKLSKLNIEWGKAPKSSQLLDL
jgi:DNA repair exonuclease SbcCD ATPase subunit